MTTHRVKIDAKPTNKAFVTLHAAQQKKTFEVSSLLTMGRDLSNHIVISDRYTSAKHATIERHEGQYTITDNKSSNGVFVNDTKVIKAHIQDKDLINIGQTQLLFTLEKPTQKDNPILTSSNLNWQKTLNQISKLAESPFPVLITGESGTGKEILAHQIHRQSKRRYGPFVSINCSAISESLIESELFGHVKGSFTGAQTDRKGAFISAKGGTLFLDEIGDLPTHLQPKLLRALENNEIKPVGADTNRYTDVRILAATHNNLDQKVKEQSFRADLFFRLNVLPLKIPSLCQRMEDFESLLYYFCKKEKVRFSQFAIEKLKKHHWPGNIRELKNVVARTSVLYRHQRVEVEHLDLLLDITLDHPPASKAKTGLSYIKKVEKDIIVEHLSLYHGNQRKTALALGIPKSTLHDRIKTYNINAKDFG